MSRTAKQLGTRLTSRPAVSWESLTKGWHRTLLTGYGGGYGNKEMFKCFV